ncbi:MAG: Y-family DNA polymerase [Treponema sp.]|jgi:DNA polymerase V|nr:Y-family DNA polymerase [Treponema sp.]
MIFHIDANSFYASCERVFRPDLTGKPIAVLTNNDGIIIALSSECKALGFKRGDVFFKERNRLHASGVAVFSSNYTLYADISSRLNLIYNRFAPDVELYSIDESFLYFPDYRNGDYSRLACEIREAVKTETGIPVSIGIAPTKTLAKLCNKLSKKRDDVCEWAKLNQDEELSACPAGDIWGIGFSKAAFLKKNGITNALQLKRYPLEKAKKNLSIVGMRTVQELNGIPAIDRLEYETRQSIACSRSFSGAVLELEPILTALADYTQETVKRLRDSGSVCKFISVYLMTGSYGEGEQYSNVASAELPKHTSYLPDILGTAVALLKQIYRKGYRYRKVMICLFGITRDNNPQGDLFEETADLEKREQIMKSFDFINNKYGRGTLHLGTQNMAKAKENENAPWLMQRHYLSPEYTTKLADVPKVY